MRIIPQRRSATALRRFEEGESVRTIVLALVADLVIATAKLISGLTSAIARVLSLRAVYTGPEEVIVAAKVHPSSSLTIEQLSRAMDELDHKIRAALPVVADVYVDVTASREDEPQPAPVPERPK